MKASFVMSGKFFWWSRISWILESRLYLIKRFTVLKYMSWRDRNELDSEDFLNLRTIFSTVPLFIVGESVVVGFEVLGRLVLRMGLVLVVAAVAVVAVGLEEDFWKMPRRRPKAEEDLLILGFWFRCFRERGLRNSFYLRV